jgi:hypothetical protein
MARPDRKVPRGARPARRPLNRGGSADGYLIGQTFYPFDTGLGGSDFSGSPYADSSVQCEVAGAASSYGSYDASTTSSGGGSYSSDSSSSSSSSDGGGGGSCD